MARTHSLEQRLMRYAALVMFIVLMLCILLVITWELDWFASISIILPVAAVSLFAVVKSYKLTLDVIERFGSQLDALANNESNSWHLAQYQSGRVANLKNDFTKLSDKIAQSKRHYMQTEEFVFEFASMLDLPIVILDPHGQVYFTNKVFLNSLTTSNVEGLSSADLGLIYNDGSWQIEKESRFKRRFIVSAQTFWRTGRNYELLTLFSIEQQLRANEQDIWQRLIRVLNHEVRNSLTPIYSMSQSLQTMKQQGQITPSPDLAQDMLQVIEKRAQHLLDFVNSYSAFAKLPRPNKQQINSEQVNLRLQAIFPELVIHSSQPVNFTADLGQLEQALINLIKNAFEAGGNTPPTLNWQQENDGVVIELTDSGTGIANSDNLFVPFYSTKAQGAGIGLVISRELIRNQGGELSVNARANKLGTQVFVSLQSR
ncbi:MULTISPECIES: HAMP domain-containing sensor histidine kinase [unclassified Pseudoalteromonas]|uniref:sensor histidine kinase n=1 Tax=unclassified Pseudoalteromonas TaxID=194690 RepID=UPI0025B46EA8|nr:MULTISPECIES: HAMP domain-containing sensor histidine kinase [unclassified Pseudoalteromonas]MDN3378720.1 HAMP domain-containing sensor histidine kinase [Pseudoalteromonas sp. APC 3893]MDN3387208.1 HAMP domain-containing sensor histidine kinase [Pseudoalteromonas sp. APC 4017]